MADKGYFTKNKIFAFVPDRNACFQADYLLLSNESGKFVI